MAFRLLAAIAIFYVHISTCIVVGNLNDQDLTSQQYGTFNIMSNGPHTRQYYHPWGRTNDAISNEMYADKRRYRPAIKRRYRPSIFDQGSNPKRGVYGLWKHVPSRRLAFPDSTMVLNRNI